MRRRAFTLIQLLIVVAGMAMLLMIFGAMFWPGYAYQRDSAQRSTCQSNLKQIGLGILMYAQDYDAYPRTAISGIAYGWADAIQPYIKSTPLFQCPTESDTTPGTNPRFSGYTDYWFNANFSGRSMTGVEELTLTIMAGEGNTGKEWTDARYAKSAFPSEWLGDQASPAYRHMETMNLLFADGHVKLRTGTPSSGGLYASYLFVLPTPSPSHRHNGGGR